jgi:hypothetical protein
VTETKGCGYLWWHADADADAGAEAVLLTGVAHARGGRLGAMQVLGSKATVGSCADCRLDYCCVFSFRERVRRGVSSFFLERTRPFPAFQSS